MTDFQEQKWIQAARKGDPDAFAELVRLYKKKVFALTTRLCKNPEDAAEAAQEAFLAVWQGLPNFRGDAAFSTWLYRLTHNACTDLLRREARHQAAAGPSFNDEDVTLSVPDPTPTPQERAEEKELRQLLAEGLETLTPEYREVLVLREIHQQSYDEIASILSLDLGTVKSRISRGRKQLRNFLLKSGNFSAATPSKESGKEGCK